MDDQISQTILDNFDVANVEHSQNEMNKINAPGVLRGIEGGALHFITVPNRDQEFIDHSFLSPEYIATHIANGFIIDLMNNHDGGGEQQPPPHFINEAMQNELAFQNDEQDRKLTTTFLQIVNKPCPVVKSANEAQVIVTNKEMGTLTQTNETSKQQNSIDHNFLTIDEQQTFSQQLLNDGQLKIYQNPQQKNSLIECNSPKFLDTKILRENAFGAPSNRPISVNPPLPPLTPIRRLNSPRKIANVNSSVNIKNEFNADSINNFESNTDTSVDDVKYQRPMAKKSLPHKKRITKKLKTIDKSDQQVDSNLLYTNQPEETVEEESITLNTQQFSCQLCGQVSESQLDFFAHLKEHYEPGNLDVKHENVKEEDHHPQQHQQQQQQQQQQHLLQQQQHQHQQQQQQQQQHQQQHQLQQSPKKESLSIHQELPPVDLNFENFTDDILTNSKHDDDSGSGSSDDSGGGGGDDVNDDQDDDQDEDHQNSVKVIEVGSNSNDDTSAKDVGINVTEVEFSDTEDMLEGIRGVVDKVQEDNDTNDGMDMISEKTWYANSALNGDINFKTGVTGNNHLSQQSVDNFSLFLKNDLEKTEEQNQNILSSFEQDDNVSRQDDEMDDDLKSSPNTESSNKEDGSNPKRKPRTPKSRKQDSKSSMASENWESSDSEDKTKVKKRIQCTKCSKLFNSANALKYHDLSHTGERPHQCNVCGKSFFALSALKVHMRLHSGDKPYECEFCKRCFRQWGDLKYHTISIHTNEKNFQCEFCGKAFARRYSLVVHRRIHTSEKNYKCEFCPKSFRASSYLQNHRKVHTGEKPYSCKVCGKKFRVSGDLKRHTNIHSRDKRKEKQILNVINEVKIPSDGSSGVIDEKKESNEIAIKQLDEELPPDNRAASLTIFYPDENYEILKSEPFDQISDTTGNDLQNSAALAVADSISTKIQKSTKRIVSVKDSQCEKNLPTGSVLDASTAAAVATTASTAAVAPAIAVDTESMTNNDFGKILQKGTNLVYFW